MSETMCYAAKFPGFPGFGAVSVDKPEYAKDNAKFVSQCIKRGATIERVTVEEARAGMGEYLAAKKVVSRPDSIETK